MGGDPGGEAAGVDLVGDDDGVSVSRYVEPDGAGEVFDVRAEGRQEYGVGVAVVAREPAAQAGGANEFLRRLDGVTHGSENFA